MAEFHIAVEWETVQVDEEAMKAAMADVTVAGPWESVLSFLPTPVASPAIQELLQFAERVLRALGLYEWQVTVGPTPLAWLTMGSWHSA